jgi:hypothetical protein
MLCFQIINGGTIQILCDDHGLETLIDAKPALGHSRQFSRDWAVSGYQGNIGRAEREVAGVGTGVVQNCRDWRIEINARRIHRTVTEDGRHNEYRTHTLGST